MLPLKNVSIYLRAALLFMLFAAVAVAVFYLPYRVMRRATLEGFSHQEILLARQAAGEIEDFFNHCRIELDRISREDDVISLTGGGRKCLERYLLRHQGEVEAVVLSDASGKILYQAGAGNPVGQAAMPEAVLPALKSLKPRISEVFSLPGGEQYVAFTVPVFRNARFSGDLSVFISLRRLADRYLASIRPGESGYSWMISRDGIELYSPFAGDVGMDVRETLSAHPQVMALADAMRAGHQGHLVYSDDFFLRRHGDPVRQLAVYTPVQLPGNTWSIAVAAPESKALAAVTAFEKWWFALFALLFVAFLLYTVFLVRMKLQRREEEQSREIEKKILENERFLSRFIDSTTIPIGIITVDGKVELINASLEKLYGYTLKDLPTVEAWFSKAYPDEEVRTRVMKVWKQRMKETVRTGNSPPAMEWTITCKDGSKRDVVFSYTLIDDRVVITLNDVTDEKALKRTERQLQQRQARARKMEAIGLMAGGVAHDLNNILSGIISYPELMLMKLPEDSELRPPLLAIKDSGERAAAVVDDLLTVARGVAGSREVASLNDLVRDYLDSPEYHSLVAGHENIRCETRLDPGLDNFSCSPIHIRKCLMNLVSNAAEAMDGSGTIVITTCNETLEQGDSERPAGNYVVLTVEDSGPGIAEEDLEHIFEPFYTRKVMGTSGTGLGLTVVWNTVVDHGGSIAVESSERGTVFRLSFPATGGVVSAQAKTEDIAALRGAGEQILVVDDEQQQRDIARQILELLGYRVLTVSSGEEALVLLQGQSVHLVVLDMVMPPGMNGLQTYQQMLSTRPDQKAIIASGYAENSAVAEALSLGAAAFIKKPYSITDLGQAVRDGLRSGQGLG